ncbi:MAG TPA: TolC family protein [Ideonella sp.]|uniref:TolC family protein n=1 Tax=Ideonella sp. TaxID=1929293 RepID=UPI002E313CCA|nr:TolC family protein [Ideonella sp.]HEX5686609.1 TolC family protein [Ideonella sp.]
MRSCFKLLALVAASLSVAACSSLKPQPVTPKEVTGIASADRLALQRDVVPLTGPLRVEDAIARAIKYNADRRVRRMEEALAFDGMGAARYDMLPRLVASAGYRDRSNDLLTLSRDLSTGNVIGGQTISSSREATTTDLTFSWSLLDFGQSYYAAKQSADRYLIATERSRRALHLLVQDVRTAFWRVAAAQKLAGELKQATQLGEAALADARKIEAEGLRSPLEPLRYQRQLLENLRLLELVDQELSTARIELAQLINAPRDVALTVVEPSTALNTAWLQMPVEQLEEQALAQNAELRESVYNARIARLETRRTMLRMFPGLSFNYAVRNSDDRYLINQSWNEIGLQLSLNLLGLLQVPLQKQMAEAGVKLADQKRMSTQMAVLSQLHVARLQYANAMRQYERADSIAQVDARIAQHVANQEAAARQTQLERVAQQTTAILSQLRRYQTLSNAQAAASKLQASLGLEPALAGADSLPIDELAARVTAALQAWEAGTVPKAPDADGPATPPHAGAQATPAPATAKATTPRATDVRTGPPA